MKNQASVKLENQAVIYRFRWDSWPAATFGPPTRTSTTTRTGTNLLFNLVDQNELLRWPAKVPVDTGKQLIGRRVVTESTRKRASWPTQNVLQTCHWARRLPDTKQNNDCRKCVSWLLRDVRQLRRQQKAAKVTIEAKVFRSFRQWHQAYVRRKEQCFEIGSWQSTISPRHEMFRIDFSGYCEDTFRAYKTVKVAQPISSELTNLENRLKSEISSDSEKATLCNQMERLVEKLDEIYAESIQKIKQEYRSPELADFSNIRSHYRDLIKQYRLSKDCGNQTSLVSSTSAVDKDPNETVIDTGNGALENAKENVEVSSRHSATQASRKQPSIANSRSSRRWQIEEMELENLRAKKET